MLGKTEDRKRRRRQRVRWLDGVINSMDMSLSKLQETGDSEGQGTWCAAVHGVTKSWTRQQLSNNNNMIQLRNLKLREARDLGSEK